MNPPTLDVDPYSEELLLAPHDYYRQLRDLGPVVRIDRYDACAIARIDLVEQVFRDWKTFCSSRGVGLADFKKESPWRPPSIILEADPPAHERTRTVMVRALSPKAVHSMQDRFAVEAEALVARAVERGIVDRVADLAEAYPLKVFADAVGLEDDDRGNLLYCIANHPQAWDMLKADHSRSAAAIEEALRAEPPIHTFCRTTATDTCIAGVELGEGTKIMCVIAAANRDPRRWDRPHVFDITRLPRPHVAFGSGIHVCVGQHVARQEASALLRALLRHVDSIQPAGEPEWRPANAVHALARLPLAFRPG